MTKPPSKNPLQHLRSSDLRGIVQLATQAPLRQRCVLAAILGFGGSHAAVVLERSPP